MIKQNGNDANNSEVFSLHSSALKPVWLHTLILSCCQFHSLLTEILPSPIALEGQPTDGLLHKYPYLCYDFSK